jgi:hypothetical protein
VELSKLVKGNIMTPQIKGLGDMAGTNEMSAIPGTKGGGGAMPPMIGGGGGGGGAQEGLGQIYSGAGTVGNAISTAAQALGGDSGTFSPGPMYKKGGYVAKGGKINLGSGRVSTASKNKSNSNW